MPSLATWFTPSLQTIARSSGRSAVLAAAYRACIKLTDDRLGITTDYTPKGVNGLASNICIGIPNDNIGLLFNSAEKAETRANATVARELMLPLSAQWTDGERRECVRDIAQMLRDKYGVAVLASIHRPARDNNNDHAHILFTTRTVDADGTFGKKTRILDDAKTGEVKNMREAVCEIVNTHAIANGSDWYVYAGKFADIIKDHIPTTHISISHGKNQRKYIEANRKDVSEAMAVIANDNNRIAAIDAEILELQKTPVIEKSSHSTPQTVEPDDWLDYVPTPPQPRLERITMPCGAELAREQLEKAHFKKADRQLQLANWKKHHAQLISAVPEPEYNIFGRPKKQYKQALAEHAEQLHTIQSSITECNDKIKWLDAYLQDPERNRLANLYHATIAHNERANDELNKRIEANAHDYEISRQQPVDWSAEMTESWREMEARREAAATYSSDNSGYGM